MIDLEGIVAGADSLVLFPRMLGTSDPVWLPVVGLTMILQSTFESKSSALESDGARFLRITLPLAILFVIAAFFSYSLESSRSARHISDFLGSSFYDMLRSLSLTPSM